MKTSRRLVLGMKCWFMSYFPLPCEDQSEAGVGNEVLVYELLSLTL